MKVTIIGPIPPPNGGMAMQTQQLINLLRQSHIAVNHIATNSPYKPSIIKHIPVLRALFRLFYYLYTLVKELKGASVIHLMANSGWSFYLFAMPVIYIASWYRIPVMMNYRGGLADEFFSKDWHWIKGALARVDKVIVPSKYLQLIFEKFGIEATVVSNIVDLSVFDFQSASLNDEKLHIVVTRNLEEIYDNGTAIEGFALFAKKYPNAILSVAGTGEQEASLKQLVAELGLTSQVNFVGRLERNQIAALYQKADILLNTSLVDNTPNSIIEALACGLVVVSSDVGGIPYLVTNKQHAFLTSPRSAIGIANQLNYVMDNKKEALEVAKNGHHMVSKFTPEFVIPQLLNLYQELK